MKDRIKQLIRTLGFDIVRFPPTAFGKNPYLDMKTFVGTKSPIVLDVGANVGQTISEFRSHFPTGVIHSFEPSPSTFEVLKQNAGHLKNVHLWNFGLGSSCGDTTFFENSMSDMSSFLQLGERGWGQVVKETPVNVKTIDQFCNDESIDKIDILKSDTQGFDLEVLKGAERMIREDRIGLVYVEVTFAEIYRNLPSISQIFDFMTSREFSLVSFYTIHHYNQVAGWTDALFVHRSYHEKSPPAPVGANQVQGHEP